MKEGSDVKSSFSTSITSIEYTIEVIKPITGVSVKPNELTASAGISMTFKDPT